MTEKVLSQPVSEILDAIAEAHARGATQEQITSAIKIMSERDGVDYNKMLVEAFL